MSYELKEEKPQQRGWYRYNDDAPVSHEYWVLIGKINGDSGGMVAMTMHGTVSWVAEMNGLWKGPYLEDEIPLKHQRIATV